MSNCCGTEEVWKAHPEYPVSVSNHGRVLSHRTGELLTNSPSANRTPGSMPRYERVNTGLSKMYSSGARGGLRENVHVLVLETFIGPRPVDEDGRPYEVDHEDDNGLNNHLTNLGTWITKEEHQRRTNARRRARKLAKVG